VIRGDDHLNNAARQMQLIEALGWPVPVYAHLPLIHGPDGAKLSKRHGALAVDAYRDMGFLPEAVCNYLLRLGWSHGNEEIIPRDRAIEWFDLDAVGRSPARFDFAKLTNLNGHYIREADDARLVALVVAELGKKSIAVGDAARGRLLRGMPGLKQRAKTIIELADSAVLYVRSRPLVPDEKAARLLGGEGRARLAALQPVLAAVASWTSAALEQAVRESASASGSKLGDLAQPLRAALTGTATSPPIFEVMEILGREESLGRIADALR
jgi:glutamyl-tRNA synthetase